ncbi:MAG: tetratricopeptide repeat protein [Chloroflexi bacterium]|nr:tetratricopeptide repeat protein [Chloroflexota bacterium]
MREQIQQLPGPRWDVRPPTNLPVVRDALIGRERDLTVARQRLLNPEVGLLTFTGAGGSGKTRLALQLATDVREQFDDGVFLVELAPLRDATLLLAIVAAALGVPERAGQPVDEILRGYLSARRLLLVLDNVEHLLAAAPAVASLLAAAPGLKVLATSRAPLRLRGEREYHVTPLAMPDLERLPGPEALRQYAAVELFVRRVAEFQPGFAVTGGNARAIADICVHLDGLPLALELAAARCRVLSPQAIAARLEHRLSLLTGGPVDQPRRHQTLRDAIAWSYDLLTETEQRLFRTLSLFVGGWTLDAAQFVWAADRDAERDFNVLDSLSSLVSNSLVRQIEARDDESRYTMLETIREYGCERLEESGETIDARGRHLTWCLDLPERAAREGNGPASATWLDRLEAEHDNLRAALQWSLNTVLHSEDGLRLASRLVNFWLIRGHHREGRSWLARLLARAPARTAVRAEALDGAGFLAVRQNDYAAGTSLLEEALSAWREIGDKRGLARTLLRFGVVPHHQRDYVRAKAMLEESLSLSREIGNLKGVEMALHYLGDLACDSGDRAAAADAYTASLALARQHGNQHGVAYALRGLGHLARARGDYDSAHQLLRESLSLLATLRDRRCIPLCLEGLACIAVGPDWAERATVLLGAANALQEMTGAPAPPPELADYQRTEADARASLGGERFGVVWAAGAALPLDAAIAYALGSGVVSIPAVSVVPALSSSQPVTVRPSKPASTTGGVWAAGVSLTPRERDVVALIAQGQSNRQIAERLVLSVRTIERHIENVYNRLGISGKAGRAIVTAYALRHGLIDVA